MSKSNRTADLLSFWKIARELFSERAIIHYLTRFGESKTFFFKLHQSDFDLFRYLEWGIWIPGPTTGTISVYLICRNNAERRWNVSISRSDTMERSVEWKLEVVALRQRLMKTGRGIMKLDNNAIVREGRRKSCWGTTFHACTHAALQPSNYTRDDTAKLRRCPGGENGIPAKGRGTGERAGRHSFMDKVNKSSSDHPQTIGRRSTSMTPVSFRSSSSPLISLQEGTLRKGNLCFHRSLIDFNPVKLA